MRSLQEIDAEIDAVKARMARRAEGLPTRESPEYRASRFDYVVEGNRQGLDQFQSALQTAMQNKLQRELTEREGEKNRQNARAIAQMGRDASAATDRINWQKSLNDSAINLVNSQKLAKKGELTSKDVALAQNAYNANVELGKSKGWYTEPVEVESLNIDDDGPFSPQNVRARYEAIVKNPEGATDEELEMAKSAAAGFMDSENVAAIRAIQKKREEKAAEDALKEAKHEDDENIKRIDEYLKNFRLKDADAAIKQIHDPERRKTYEAKLKKRREDWKKKEDQAKEEPPNNFLK
jgi:hypothetical protein